MVDVPPARLRVRQACVPCKQRKRRCNGTDPCSTCIRYEYDCVYEEAARKRRNHVSPKDPGAQTKSPNPGTNPSTPASLGVTSHENIHYSADFNKILGRMIEEDEQQDLPAWNASLEEERPDFRPRITSTISLELCASLAATYFENIHRVFGFIDKEAFYEKMNKRWNVPDETDDQDSILCGVAALGSLFSSGFRRSQHENSLVSCARLILESDRVLSSPSWDQIGAWHLRTMYLRGTCRPNPGWLTSCVTMHLIEALEMDAGNVRFSNTSSETSLVLKDRTFWISRLFNDWISHEYGRSKVAIKVDVPLIPEPHDNVLQMLQIYEAAEFLDPSNLVSPASFESAINRVALTKFDFDGAILSKTILGFALYRRLRVISPFVSRETVNEVLQLGDEGMRAARRMAKHRQPWWHIANVPFQFLCVILVMDTKESLARVEEAMRTLQEVSECFPMKTTRKLVEASQRLIRLSQKRKLADVVSLDKGLVTDLSGERLLPTPVPQEEVLDWTDMLGISETEFDSVDWGAFLRNMDVPICDTVG